MDNTKKLNVLSIAIYGGDFAQAKNKVFSGAGERQVDYAGFLDKYLIIYNSQKEDKKIIIKDNLWAYPIKAKTRIDFLKKAYKLSRKLIPRENINIVATDNPHLSASLGALLKYKHKIKLLIHSMAEMIDNPFYIKERPLNYFKNLLAKINTAFADKVRVSTKTEVRRMRQRGFNEKKIALAPFYIDFSLFSSVPYDETLRQNILGEDYEQLIMFVGRIALQKDLVTSLKAVKEVVKDFSKVLFLVVGDGPEMSNIKKIAKELKLENNVKFIGKLPYQEVKKYYRIADVFLATSIYEGTCMTLHEAAICKLPIVATCFAGAVDLIREGENGYLAEIGDWQTVAKKIKKILSDRKLAVKMGERNYEIIVSEFNKEKAVKKYEDMFRSLSTFAPID